MTYSRACVGQLVDTSISGVALVGFLDQISCERSLPRTLVMDNGPEPTSKAMFLWSRARDATFHFIQPGDSMQNGFVESFNGKFRDGCLNQHWFTDLRDARETINIWRQHYNQARPQAVWALCHRQFTPSRQLDLIYPTRIRTGTKNGGRSLEVYLDEDQDLPVPASQ
ncbi:MAG: integrase core domain-containing protein [Gammaproteobacteria bacterium]